MDADHIEAEIEIFPEFAVRDHAGEVLVGGRNHPDIHLDSGVAAHALNGALAEGAQQLDLDGGVDLPQFIKEERASVGLFKAADAAFHGTREGAFFVAKQFAFQQLGTERGTVNDDELRLGAAAEIVDRMGDEFLAGAAFSLHQHGGAGGSDLRDGLEDALHRDGLPEDTVEGITIFDLTFQRGVFQLQLAAAESTFDEEIQRFKVQGLGDKVPRPPLHGLHGGIHAAVGGHHDDDRSMRHGDGGFDQFHAVIRPEPEVGEHDIHPLIFQDFHRLGPVCGDVNVVVILQGKAQSFPGVFFVVDNQNGGIHVRQSVHGYRGRQGCFAEPPSAVKVCWKLRGCGESACVIVGSPCDLEGRSPRITVPWRSWRSG